MSDETDREDLNLGDLIGILQDAQNRTSPEAEVTIFTAAHSDAIFDNYFRVVGMSVGGIVPEVCIQIEQTWPTAEKPKASDTPEA